LLTRDPEPDKAITGRHLIWAKTGEDQGWPVVHFRLNKVGGDLCYDLTSLNRPDEETGFKRHLAIILDGRIVSAPSISAPFRSEAMIAGQFTRAEVDSMAETLRSVFEKKE
jgi:preprotein translocase subunit SecD